MSPEMCMQYENNNQAVDLNDLKALKVATGDASLQFIEHLAGKPKANVPDLSSCDEVGQAAGLKPREIFSGEDIKL